MYSCDDCGADFSRRFNLTRHKNGRCRSYVSNDGITSNTLSSESPLQFHCREKGKGLIMDYTHGYDNHQQPKRQLDDDSFDGDIAKRQLDDDSFDGDITSSEIDSVDDDDHSDDDGDCVWERLFILNYASKTEPLSMLKSFIFLHIASEFDKTFQSVMSDITKAESRGLSLEEGIEYALRRNKIMILSSVNKCDKDGDMFWCGFSEMRGDLDCQWSTGESCFCRKCNGRSIFDVVRSAVHLFVGMRDDDMIQKIEEEIETMSDGLDSLEKLDIIDKVVEKYHIDIHKKLEDAKALLFSSDEGGKPISNRKDIDSYDD